MLRGKLLFEISNRMRWPAGNTRRAASNRSLSLSVNRVGFEKIPESFGMISSPAADCSPLRSNVTFFLPTPMGHEGQVSPDFGRN